MYKKDLPLQLNDILSMPISSWSDDMNLAAITDYVDYLYEEPLLYERQVEAMELLNHIEDYELIDDISAETFDITSFDNYEKVKKITAKLYYVVFESLTEVGIKKFVDTFLLEMANLKDMRYLFKSALESIHRDNNNSWAVRESVIGKIFDSDRTIGSVKINIGKNFESVEPTVHNWILDYIRSAGDQVGTPLGLVSYLNKSQNVASISSDEVFILKKVLELYDFLKYHLEEPMENPDLIVLIEGVKKADQKIEELAKSIDIENEQTHQDDVFDKDKKENTDQETNTRTITMAVGPSGVLSAPAQTIKEEEYTIDDLHNEYGVYISKHPEVRAREQMILNTIGNNKASVVTLMQEYIEAKDVVGIHALLRSSAQNGILLDIIMADAKYSREYWGNITTLFGEQYASKDSFLKKPAPYVSVFMQWVFRVVLGLEALETSFIGVDIYNVLVGMDSVSFEKLMYADITAKQFRWRRIGKNKETLGFK